MNVFQNCPPFLAKKAVAWILRLSNKLLKRVTRTGLLSVEELAEAELKLIKVAQRKAFPKEISVLPKSKDIHMPNSSKKLNSVFILGVLRVESRLRCSTEDFEIKHPVILPCCAHMTRLLIKQRHREIGHCGMSHTWMSLRQTYWLLKRASTLRKVSGQCLFCQRRNYNLGSQLMADLPEGSVTSNHSPFYFRVVGCLFYFMYDKVGVMLRATAANSHVFRHRQFTSSSYPFSTEAFINALRRFISRSEKSFLN